MSVLENTGNYQCDEEDRTEVVSECFKCGKEILKGQKVYVSGDSIYCDCTCMLEDMFDNEVYRIISIEQALGRE